MGLGSRCFEAAIESSARQPRRGAMFIVKTARTLPSSVRSRITSNAQDFPPHSGGLFPSSGGLFPPSGGQFPSYSLEEKSTIVREPALRQEGNVYSTDSARFAHPSGDLGIARQ